MNINLHKTINAKNNSGFWVDLDSSGLDISDPYNVIVSGLTSDSEYRFQYCIESSACTQCSTLTINTCGLPEVSASTLNQSVVLYEGDDIYFSGYTQSMNFRWESDSGFNSKIKNPILRNIHPSQSGKYCFIATSDCNNCEKQHCIDIDIIPKSSSGKDTNVDLCDIIPLPIKNPCDDVVIITPNSDFTNSTNAGYGDFGTYFGQNTPITVVNETGSVSSSGVVLNSGGIWDSDDLNTRMNLSAIQNNNGIVDICFTATSNAMSVGFAADNGGLLKVNGVTIINLQVTNTGVGNYNFKRWWIVDYPINIGDCICIKAENFGGPFAVALEAYSENTTQLQNFTTINEINDSVVFNTRTVNVEGYSCNVGYTLINPNGCDPCCKQI